MIDHPWVVILNTSGVFVLVMVVAGYFLWVEKSISELVRYGISVILAGVMVVLLKELFVMPRPYAANGAEPMAGLAVLSSFPSFHAALAFSAATKVVFHKRRLGLTLMAFAALVGLGRVLAEVHYPMDVLIGVVVGVSVAGLIESLIGKKTLS